MYWYYLTILIYINCLTTKPATWEKSLKLISINWYFSLILSKIFAIHIDDDDKTTLQFGVFYIFILSIEKSIKFEKKIYNILFLNTSKENIDIDFSVFIFFY